MTFARTTERTERRAVVIRFPQVDPAGIVFYPRYFELVARLFPDVPMTEPPFGVKTQFLKPNRFGDRIELEFESAATDWSVTGRMNGADYFSMKSIDPGDAHTPDTGAFRTNPESVGRWCTGADGRMQLSRYFEFLNMAIEEWFEATLGLPFADLHVGKGIGIPTVQFDTRVFALPAAGDEFSISIRMDKTGRRSMTFTSLLVGDGSGLVENRQVVVFVRMLDESYASIDIPADIRSAFGAQAGS